LFTDRHLAPGSKPAGKPIPIEKGLRLVRRQMGPVRAHSRCRERCRSILLPRAAIQIHRSKWRRAFAHLKPPVGVPGRSPRTAMTGRRQPRSRRANRGVWQRKERQQVRQHGTGSDDEPELDENSRDQYFEARHRPAKGLAKNDHQGGESNEAHRNPGQGIEIGRSRQLHVRPLSLRHPGRSSASPGSPAR
jgi:hypothetical protein